MMKFKKVALLVLFFVCFSAFLGYCEDEIIPLIKFKDADINVVLQSIAQKAIRDERRINIVSSPNVSGLVSVNLENVDWFTALEAVLRSYNYSYEWIGENIILVDTLEKISEREAQEKERQEVEVPRTKVFSLRYIDANDAKKAIEPLLSVVGRASVLEITGQAGWEFGTDVTKRTRQKEGKISRTKILIVSDISKKIEEVESLLAKIDKRPKQILIKTKIMEVNKDVLEDFGFDWGTGTTGASGGSYIGLDQDNDKEGLVQMLGDQVTPSIFNPLEGTSLTTANAGLMLAIRNLAGTEFEAVLHALEEDGRTNTLSAPVILTLNNQEASILVGQKYPIIKTETSAETSQITGGSLDYYQDIGIQLNVVPQISGENEDFINMIIHPAVTTRLADVSVTDQAGTTLVSYPWLSSREAETQVMIKDGETIAIGGLIKDVVSKEEIGVPILSKIPVIGWFFKRYTEDTEKIDLLIFITAKIIEPGQIKPQQFLETQKIDAEFKGQIE